MKEVIVALAGIIFAIMTVAIKILSGKVNRAEKRADEKEKEIEVLHNAFAEREQIETIAVEQKQKKEAIKETYEEEKRAVEDLSKEGDDADVIASANDFYNKLRNKYKSDHTSEN